VFYLKNNSIALLVGIFIVISLASILSAPRGAVYITGHAASGDSYTTFNLSEEVSILVTGAVNFGAGRVDINASNAILDSGLGSYDYHFTNISADVGNMPSKRFSPMVFDSDRGVFVMYGGLLWGVGVFNDTWEFNYSSKTWTHVTSADSSADGVPGEDGLLFNAIAYDSSAKKTIIFGGQDGVGTRFNDTWAYNGINWTKMNPDNYPPERIYSTMIFDSNRNVSVLFGGKDGGPFDETWEYNYSADNWTQIDPDTSPSARTSAGMTFDSKTNKVILFGGQDASNDYLNDTWEYDGTDWTDVTTGAAPSARIAGIFYDPLRDRVLLQLGGDSVGFPTDIWDYDPSTHLWHRIYDTNLIPAVGAVNFDTKNNVTVFFFGTNSVFTAANYTNETWVFNYSAAGGNANGSWFVYKDYFFIENDGTVNISVNFSANKNANKFIGGTSPSFKIKGIVDESNACPDLNTAYADVPNSTETPGVLCPLLQFAQDKDIFDVATKLVVPSDIIAGDKSATITFSAAKV